MTDLVNLVSQEMEEAELHHLIITSVTDSVAGEEVLTSHIPPSALEDSEIRLIYSLNSLEEIHSRI